MERKRNDDAFAEVIVYKIYMSPVYGSVSRSLCVIKERVAADRGEEASRRDVGERSETDEELSLTNIEVSETSTRTEPRSSYRKKKLPSLNLSKCLYLFSPLRLDIS